MNRFLSIFGLTLLLCACSGIPGPIRWTDRSGGGRSESDLQRDRERCRLVQGTTIDPRERLRADDCSTVRATSVSCTLSDNARRTEGDTGSFDACMRAAGWDRKPDVAHPN